ncbi:MAG: hypothetical protein V9E88_11270 [Ferruginibacter sp.]
MRIFSKIVALCNICFIIAVILRAVELAKRAKGNHDGAIPFQPLESTIVILGYGAIFINIIFLLFSIYWLIRKKIKLIPRWIVIFNLLVLPAQVYFFFFYN